MNAIAYIAHGHCYLWQKPLITLHAVSDSFIAIAYFSIPITLVYFVRCRRDVPFPSIFWLFSAFIVSCGITHLFQLWTLWHPDYWLSGIAKAITAWISIVTAISLVPLLSRALTLPGVEEVQSLNQTLQQEIEERQRVEAFLQRYERIVSTIKDGIFLLDTQGTYQIANDTYLSWHQKQPEEVLGCSIRKVIGDTLYYQKIHPYLNQCLAGQSSQTELWVEYPSLGWQFMSVGYTPYEDESGDVSGVIVALRNLTPLKQTQEALQASELRFRGIFDQMYQFIGLLTPDGTVLEANRTALEFGGLTLDDIRGRPFWDIVWWGLSAAIRTQLQTAIAQAAQGQFVRYEVPVQGQRGKVITIDFSIRPVLDEAGKVVWLIPEGRDISDRIQAEKELQLQAVVTRNMAEGICLVRADNGIIVYANPKFERMFGYGPHELDGHHVSVVNYPTADMTPEEVNQVIRTAVLTNQEATYEVYNVKKDGTPFWCQATTSVFNHPDYGPVLVAVQQDISDRKEAQEKIQASLQEKELLLKEIYHRVKNNLQVVYSLLNLQSRNLADPVARSAIKDSQSRIRAMALVHEKLYQSTNLTGIDLADYVRSMVHSLQETYYSAMNELSVQVEIAAYQLDIETALPCGLILTELLSNSFKYAFPDGRAGHIIIRSTPPSLNYIHLIIQDDGIGLPASINFQHPPSLGLNLVRNLAKQIGGQIKILPSDTGTTFQLSLPYQESTQCPAKQS